MRGPGVVGQRVRHARLRPCCSNYRTWVLVACYGCSFGVELTINNNLASYLNSHFDKSILAAGNFTSVFGLMNLIARPTGERFGTVYCHHHHPSHGCEWIMTCSDSRARLLPLSWPVQAPSTTHHSSLGKRNG